MSGGGRGFEAAQRSYYRHEINRALPTQQSIAALSSATIRSALGLTDPAAPAGTIIPSDAASYFSQFGASSGAVQRDAECRGTPYPGPAMRDPAARAGCGWWFVPDPMTPSVGAYGTRRGPMSPTLDTQVGAGRWIWDTREAQQAEGQKQAARIQTCPDIAYTQYPNIGWCPGTNMALVTDGAGNPAYPQSPGGDCPGGGIVMNAAACPPPPPPAPGAPPALPSGISGLCTPQANGALSPACLSAIASWQCSANGTLALSLSSGYAGSDPTFNSMNSVLQQRGFQIHPGIVNDGQLSISDAFRSVVGLQQQAAAGDGSRTTGAAANLCYGSPFDPCALSDSDAGPFSPDCVSKAALAAGWGAAGAQMPANGGMDAWNALPNWGAVRTAIANTKRQADNPPGATGGSFAGQMAAIYGVYGVKPATPRIGCNYQGISLLRWLAPTGSTPQSLFPAAGAQTHFLGRYLARNGFPNQAAPTAADMTPAGGFLTECQRYTTVFQPTTGGNYQFMSMSPDPVRMFLNGNLFMDWQGSGNAVTPIAEMIAEQQYTLTVDIMNSGGDWGFQLQASVGGGTWGPIPATQLFLPADRRQPLLELAFNKMATGATGATQDTNGIIQNWKLFGSTRIGTVAGRPCMVVGGSGQGCYNFNNYAQGIRSRALKSFTMMLNIQSITLGRDGRGGSYTPSFVAFYNLPSTNTAGYPRTVWAPDSLDFPTRTTDFEITGYNGSIYAYGKGPSVDPTTGAAGPDTQTVFTSNITAGAISYPQGQWFHFAFVWDDDFSGYAIYINGKVAANLPAAVVDPRTIYEQIRIGSDATDDGAAWTGGIAWFRGFDYRLSQDLIARDMSDDWADLV